MREEKSETPTEVRKTISRRVFCEAGVAALSAELLSGKTFAFAKDDRATLSNASGLPTLEEMGTGWLDCGLLAQMPSMHNFSEMAACAPDLVGVNFLPGGQLYGDESGPLWPIYNSLPKCGMTIDGRSYDSTSCRWFAYQAVRRAQAGDLDVVNTNRLVIEDTVILWRVKFTNSGLAANTFDVTLTTDIGWKPQNQEIIGPGEIRAVSDRWKMDAVYRFFDLPQNRVDGQFAGWRVSLAPGESREIRFLMHVEEAGKPGHKDLSSEWFETQWDRTKAVWENRWESAFTPGNNFFSGNAPLLVTEDAAIREIYYRSVLTLLVLLRTNLWSNRTFITSGERAKGTVFYWDTSLFSTIFALLEPEQMKAQIRLFLEQDPHESAVIVFNAERPSSPTHLEAPDGWDLRGYAANDLSIFRLTWSYLVVTQDRDFLREKIADQTVLDRMHVLATNWKKLRLHPDDQLADYGGALNLLECVPTYINKVPSFNSANVWMMREVADILEENGDNVEARRLRVEADTVLKAVMTLYEPGKGVWVSLHRDGTRVEMRHCYDFATVGRFLARDLPSSVRREMVDFVQRELLMEKWMRAQSQLDVAAANSDRPDHGPMGAYDAWPAVTVDALCRLGNWDVAVPFLRRTQAAVYEGVYAQAREFYGAKRRDRDAPVRIAQRQGCMRECTGGGAFAETVLCTLFGYLPKLGGELDLLNADTPRSFTGELRHLRHGTQMYTIQSGNAGLRLQKET
ncbi:MAG TPA: hypothetical protein VKR52_18370 [Terracidiphilus sp.]|nr:hypothetical protein [Terracidiphilus sp.]